MTTQRDMSRAAAMYNLLRRAPDTGLRSGAHCVLISDALDAMPGLVAAMGREGAKSELVRLARAGALELKRIDMTQLFPASKIHASAVSMDGREGCMSERHCVIVPYAMG